MKTLLFLALLAAPALAEIRIRVTDDVGNVGTAVISATNRIAYVNEWIDEKAPGTNTVAEKLAALAKEHVVGWSIEAKREKVRKAKLAEADAAAATVEP